MVTKGTQLMGRYRLDELVGRGGLGDVWRATDVLLNRTLAAKIMPPSALDEDSKRQFFERARTMAAISHPCSFRFMTLTLMTHSELTCSWSMLTVPPSRMYW